MTTAIHSLQNIPFSHLIGGPLNATVHAQAQAAMTCIEFIERVGFTVSAQNSNDKIVKEVTFKYNKLNDAGQTRSFTLSVPILAIVPIPYLRVDEVLIDFTAKLNDSITTDETSVLGLGASLSGHWGPVSFRASASYKNERSTTSSSTQDYCMSVKVRAVQAEVPGGMKRILDMLEAAIRDTETPPSTLTRTPA